MNEDRSNRIKNIQAMWWWRGHGYIVPIVLGFSLTLPFKVLNFDSPYLKFFTCVSLLSGSLILYLVGKNLNKEKVFLGAKHSFFKVPVENWGYVLLVFFVFFMFA
jgi:hypothetical protein